MLLYVMYTIWNYTMTSFDWCKELKSKYRDGYHMAMKRVQVLQVPFSFLKTSLAFWKLSKGIQFFFYNTFSRLCFYEL